MLTKQKKLIGMMGLGFETAAELLEFARKEIARLTKADLACQSASSSRCSHGTEAYKS